MPRLAPRMSRNVSGKRRTKMQRLRYIKAAHTRRHNNALREGREASPRLNWDEVYEELTDTDAETAEDDQPGEQGESGPVPEDDIEPQGENVGGDNGDDNGGDDGDEMVTSDDEGVEVPSIPPRVNEGPRKAQYPCMHCLRSAMNAHLRGVNRHGFAINREFLPIPDCWWDETGSSRCDQCIDRNDQCALVLALMFGDYLDMLSLIKVMEVIRRRSIRIEQDDEHYDFRLGLSALATKVLQDFDALEAAHRRHWEMTASKKPTNAVISNYESIVDSRRDTSHAYVAFVREWTDQLESDRLAPRLFPTDAGFMAWNSAKKRAYQGLIRLIHDKAPRFVHDAATIDNLKVMLSKCDADLPHY